MKITRMLLVILCFIYPLVVHSAQTPAQAAIASAHPLATQAGMEILNQGGNAFDAAVTVAAVLAVVEPYHSGLGGGGFWLLHDARRSPAQDIFIDGRERAPRSATQDMYVKQGHLQPTLAEQGPLAAAIPGEVAGITFIAKQYGNLPLTKTLSPAIALAELGFAMDELLILKLNEEKDKLLLFPQTSQIFFPTNEPLRAGLILKQPELALVLKAIANEGHQGFYQGEVAKLMVEGVQQAGGIWSLDDLKHYQIVVRTPLKGEYHGIKITTAPLPSSGGVEMLSALNILRQFEMHPLSDADRKHLIIESLRRAYCDRLSLGDPDNTHVDVKSILSPEHAKQWRQTIQMDKATSSETLHCGQGATKETNTTHYSILDKQGNAVSATLSINTNFGSGFMIPKTGILLNNEMDDFSIAKGAQDVYGLVTSNGNLIQAKKRPLSNMTPTFIETKRGFGILGTPGGSRIPSMVLLAILTAQTDEYPYTWIITPRYHHQYLPDHVFYEPGAFTAETQHALIARGHELKQESQPIGNMQAVFWDQHNHKVMAASDPRWSGQALVQ